MEKMAFDLVLKHKQGFYKTFGNNTVSAGNLQFEKQDCCQEHSQRVAMVWIQCFSKARMVKDWSCPLPILFCFLVDLKWATSCTMDLARSHRAHCPGLTPQKQSNECFPLLSSSFQVLSHSNGKEDCASKRQARKDFMLSTKEFEIHAVVSLTGVCIELHENCT